MPNLKTKNMSFIQKLFKSRKVNEPMNSALNIPVVIPRLSSEWVRFEDEKPPHGVVLAACDTYDCGWTMDTVWWYGDKKCWMTIGAVESKEAYLPYTYWRKLPPFPKNRCV